MSAAQQNVIEADGFEDVAWGGWCPVQALGYVDGCAIYFRARGARWSLTIGRGRALTEWGLPAHVAWTFVGSYGEFPDAGWMDDAHVRRIILVAVAVWRARGGERGPAGVVTLAAPFVPDRWSDFGRYTLTANAEGDGGMRVSISFVDNGRAAPELLPASIDATAEDA